MSTTSLFYKAVGAQSLEPLVDAAAAYDAAAEENDHAEVNAEHTDPPAGSSTLGTSSSDARAALFARVLELSRPFSTRGALGCLAVLHTVVFALSRPLDPNLIKTMQKLRVPFYAPRPQVCGMMCFAGAALSMNVGFRILRADANACYDYYVRNGLRRRARCLGAAEIVCPIARLVARFSGKSCSATAESACPLNRAPSPCPVDSTTAGPMTPLGVGAQELNISTCSKETSHQTTALPTPRSASLRTRSFTLPDDVDAAIGVAAAHDSDEDTAWETEEVVEASPSTGAPRLVPGLHYQHHHHHAGQHRGRHHSHPHRRQFSLDSNVGVGEKAPSKPPSGGSSGSSPAVPVVLADPSPSGDDASTSHLSAATPTVIAAARAPLLSRAAFIVSFEQHRRTAVRLYLGVQVARFFASTFFRTQRMLSCCCAGLVHVGLLVRLRRELAYVDCSARASLGPVVAWSVYILVLGCNIYVSNRSQL